MLVGEKYITRRLKRVRNLLTARGFGEVNGISNIKRGLVKPFSAAISSVRNLVDCGKPYTYAMLMENYNKVICSGCNSKEESYIVSIICLGNKQDVDSLYMVGGKTQKIDDNYYTDPYPPFVRLPDFVSLIPEIADVEEYFQLAPSGRAGYERQFAFGSLAFH